MKNIFLSIAVLCSMTAFGQEKTISFEKKISYKVILSDEYSSFLGDDEVYLNTYIAKDALLGNFEGGITTFLNSNPFQQESFLIQNNRVFQVSNHSLENRLSIKLSPYYQVDELDSLKPYDDNFIGDFVSIQKLNTTQKINGYNCNDYEIISKNDNEENSSTKICIDEKNQLNNASYLFPQANVKGLLVSLNSDDLNGFIIDKVTNSSAKVSFDEKNEIESFKAQIVKQKERYKELYDDSDVSVDSVAVEPSLNDNRYEDPMVNYYSYGNSDNENVNTAFNTIAYLAYSVVLKDGDYDGNYDYDRSKALKTAESSTKAIIKEYKKNSLLTKDEAKELEGFFKKLYQDAKEFKLVKQESYYEPLDYAPEETVDSAWTDYDAYQSTYKTDDISRVSLAIELPYLQEYLKAAPEHCQDLKTKIPTFSDKDLGNLVYNYTGQVCDLYIFNSGNVALAETINALRKSVLEINNRYDKLKKEDKEKLTTFLNSLD